MTSSVPEAHKLNEHGSASVEAIVILPALFGIFFLIVQGAVWLQAGNIAQSAASSAYNTARLYQSSANAGEAAGYATAEQSGTILEHTTVTVTITDTTVTARVTADGTSLVPGFPTKVDRTVTGPRERWIE